MEEVQVVEKATPTTSTPTQSPVDSPSAFKGKGMDEVFRAADAAAAEPEKPQTKQEMVDEILAEKTEEGVETKSEAEPAEPEAEKPAEPEAELTQDDWKTRLPKIRRAVEAIADPKMRKLLINAYMTAQPYHRAGIKMSDIEHYKAVAPTPEVLDEIVGTADQMNDLRSAISHGSPEAAQHVLRTMVQIDPNGTRQFISNVVEHLEELHPPAWRAAGIKLFRNVVANMRRDAKENPLLEESARDVAIYVGLEAEESESSEKAELPAHAQQKIEELELLKRQEAERRQLEAQARRDEVFRSIREFHQGVISESFQEGAKVVQDWIDEYAGSYNDATKAKLFDSIGDELVRRVDKNPHIQAQYDKILRSGNGSPEHRAQARQYLINQARSLLPVVAAPVLREFSEIANGARVRRQDKLTTASSRRDLGSSGAAPMAPRAQPLSGRGKTMDQVFAEFEAQQK